ncbi:hypothetical protein [Streptomyces ziwulingensis]|uniref:Uncharacterized protein n=1 Tax=Streptomyces ziwulingensis TaxID=1045501 RepID=A0ABP9CLC5_9ACTN
MRSRTRLAVVAALAGGAIALTAGAFTAAHHQDEAPWAVAPAGADGHRDTAGVDPDYPLPGSGGPRGDGLHLA